MADNERPGRDHSKGFVPKLNTIKNRLTAKKCLAELDDKTRALLRKKIKYIVGGDRGVSPLGYKTPDELLNMNPNILALEDVGKPEVTKAVRPRSNKPTRVKPTWIRQIPARPGHVCIAMLIPTEDIPKSMIMSVDLDGQILLRPTRYNTIQ